MINLNYLYIGMYVYRIYLLHNIKNKDDNIHKSKQNLHKLYGIEILDYWD